MIFISHDKSNRDFLDALNEQSQLKRLVRAAGNIRILLLGAPSSAAASKPTRPIATGTFSFPVFNTN